MKMPVARTACMPILLNVHVSCICSVRASLGAEPRFARSFTPDMRNHPDGSISAILFKYGGSIRKFTLICGHPCGCVLTYQFQSTLEIANDFKIPVRFHPGLLAADDYVLSEVSQDGQCRSMGLHLEKYWGTTQLLWETLRARLL